MKTSVRKIIEVVLIVVIGLLFIYGPGLYNLYVGASDQQEQEK